MTDKAEVVTSIFGYIVWVICEVEGDWEDVKPLVYLPSLLPDVEGTLKVALLGPQKRKLLLCFTAQCCGSVTLIVTMAQRVAQ